jgi:hypothetical protein
LPKRVTLLTLLAMFLRSYKEKEYQIVPGAEGCAVLCKNLVSLVQNLISLIHVSFRPADVTLISA